MPDTSSALLLAAPLTLAFFSVLAIRSSLACAAPVAVERRRRLTTTG
jgi:hypothetical protein